MTGTPGARTYRRTLRLPYGTALAAVRERTRAPRTGTGTRPGGWLDARLHLTDLRDLTTAVQRLRRLFDLDADPYAVDERLGADPRLAPLVAARPGLRSPGAVDPLEPAVRALTGTRGARELVRRYGKVLDAPHGGLTHVFPEPAVLAEAEPFGPLGALALPPSPTAPHDWSAGADRHDAEEALLALPGMDPATVATLRVRALGDPDVAPPGADVPDSWRPWRSYAVQHLRVAGEPIPPDRRPRPAGAARSASRPPRRPRCAEWVDLLDVPAARPGRVARSPARALGESRRASGKGGHTWSGSVRVLAVLLLTLLAGPDGTGRRRTRPAALDRQLGAAPSGTAAALPGAAVRNVVHLSIGGTAVRVRLSNRLGTRPLRLGAVTVARCAARPAPTPYPAPLRTAAFHGAPEVTVPPGADTVTDPVRLPVPAGADRSSPCTHRTTPGPPPTTAPPCRPATWPGPAPAGPPTVRHRVHGHHQPLVPRHRRRRARGSAAGSVVAFGDSLTDGNGSTPTPTGAGSTGSPGGCSATGPASSTRASPATACCATAPDRAPSPTWTPTRWTGPAYGRWWSSRASTTSRAPRRRTTRTPSRTPTAPWWPGPTPAGIRVVGVTLTPYGGYPAWTAAGEDVRQRVNAFIRTGGAFDAVADADAAVRDPADPRRIRAGRPWRPSALQRRRHGRRGRHGPPRPDPPAARHGAGWPHSTAPSHAPAISRRVNSSASTLEPPARIAVRSAAIASPCRPSRSRSSR